MERRGFPDSGSFGASGTPSQDDLVARSRAWMNRTERSRDPWRRSVDDFLDEGFKNKVRERSRSPRDRGRDEFRRGGSRERSKERRSSSRRKSDDEEESEYRRSSSDTGSWNDRPVRSPTNSRDRLDRQEWSNKRMDERRRRDDETGDKRWLIVDSWSQDDENSSNCDKSDYEFDIGKFYGPDRREDRYTYKKQTPQKTIIIRGLAQHITEVDIRSDIMATGINFSDIRLVRRKDTGASRGFAFVEFYDVADATKWIEMKQGELMLKDHFRALLQYSLPRDDYNYKDRYSADWRCRCTAHNFRRREICYKCHVTRREGQVFDEMDEVSSHPTNTVLLMGLDTLTTEDAVLRSIKYLSSLPIRSVRIGRDSTTNVSKGVCYLEMNSVVDANCLYYSLTRNPLIIDNRTVGVHYAKLDPIAMHYSATVSGQMATAAVAAAQWSHQKPVGSGANSTQFTLADVSRLAEYSASLYATNPQEKASYLTYYEDYYKKQISDGNQIALPNSSSDTESAGWAGAQAAYAAAKAKVTSTSVVPLTEAPDDSGSQTYPIPDVSSYQYDKSSGYYYDPYTTLYYDANSQYYYNSKTQKFLYWDAAKKTYLPAPTQSSGDIIGDASNESKEDDKKRDKEGEKDKVKVAKRIAKDMEKWAKTLNQKKEIAKQNIVAAQQAMVANLKAPGSADIGYAVLERKELATSSSNAPLLFNGVESKPSNSSLVAAYSDSDEDQSEDSVFDEKQHIDLSKMACLLCKRQFQSKDILMKHVQMSDLHKQNLASWYRARGIDMDEASSKKLQYRDRAKERRQKYGEPDTPHPNRLKETYMKAKEAAINYEEPTKEGIGADNLGNKLLQKMGWQEGMGLGKSNQGRTNIIQAERRTATAGLGTKSAGVTPGPGETYKDCVKRMMLIRYNDIDQ